MMATAASPANVGPSISVELTSATTGVNTGIMAIVRTTLTPGPKADTVVPVSFSSVTVSLSTPLGKSNCKLAGEPTPGPLPSPTGSLHSKVNVFDSNVNLETSVPA